MDVLEAGASLDAAVVSHYQLVAPIMEQLFGPIPLVWAAFPFGADRDPQYHAHYFGHWTKLSAAHIERLVSIGAREFYSWSPTPEDPARCRFARLLLDAAPGMDASCLKDAATALRTLLKEEGRDAIPVLDGLGNIALWVPLANGPSYEQVRAWAHALAARAVQEYGDILSTAFNTRADARIHLHVSSNAVDLWSILPYSVRAKTGRISTPIAWDELASIDMLGIPVQAFPARLSSVGDVFGEMLHGLKPQPLPELSHPEVVEGPLTAPSPPGTKRGAWYGHGLMAATVRDILSDGVARTAPEIWKIAQDRKLHVASSESELVNDIDIYLNREIAHGQKPLFIRTIDHKFQINEPSDPWPATVRAPQIPTVDLDALISRLRTTGADGARSEEFEVAVCGAFAALGLLTTHLGGHAAPDGYADAPLGPKGFRVMLECKAGETLRKGPDIYEAAKYKDAYHARYCVLIGGGSGTSQQEAISEIKTHGVALWCADDLVYALQSALTPLELEPAFAPGVVAQDVIPDILWARDHGQRKRVHIIAEIVRLAGWTTQCAAAQANTPADAPLLTEDAAMLLVDQELAAQGSHVNCTREEVRLAFEWLTNPLNGAAVWNADETAIVIITPKEK